MSAQVGRGVLRRLDLARSGFFARVKAGETPGFPKFEAARRWDSIEIPQPTAGMVKADGRGEWANMNSVAMIESTRWTNGATSVHRRYFITSLPARADRILGAVREHWGVENGLHWTLDVSFGEDWSVIRVGHAAENMSTLRRLALNLVKGEKSLKIGVAAKRKRAGWDLDYLRAILRLAQ